MPTRSGRKPAQRDKSYRRTSNNMGAHEASELCGRLTCIGTVHYDPAGYTLLKRFLDHLQPDLILLELSPYGRRYRRRHQRDLLRGLLENLKIATEQVGVTLRQALKNPEIAAIRRQLSLPYEYRAARSYARLRGASLRLVDASSFSMQWILQWTSLVKTENLFQLLRAPSRRISVQESYRIAQEALQDQDFRKAWLHSRIASNTNSGFENIREQTMANRISMHIAFRRPRVPIFIGGWAHLVGGIERKTLRTLLSLSPSQCRLLRSQS